MEEVEEVGEGAGSVKLYELNAGGLGEPFWFELGELEGQAVQSFWQQEWERLRAGDLLGGCGKCTCEQIKL